MAEDHDKTNPTAGVDALVDPSPLTIAQVAVLSRANSPVLFGRVENLDRALEALYLTSIPAAEAVRRIKAGTAQDDAVAWAEAELREPGAYADRMVALLDAIAAFWKMLPNGDPQKKTPSDTGTDGSPNSSSGSAAHTVGGLNT